MYLTGIRLRGIRAFEDLKLELVDANGAPQMRSVVIGQNGTCKTTLLRAIVLGLGNYSEASGLLQEEFGLMVGEAAEKGIIELDVAPTFDSKDAAKLSKTIVRLPDDREEVEFEKPEFASTSGLVCAYGAGRGYWGKTVARAYTLVDSTFSLFDYESSAYIDPELALRRLRDYRDGEIYEVTLVAIRRALGLSEEDGFELGDGGGVFVSGPRIGNQIPIEGWADGYRFPFTMILDIYAWALRADAIEPDGSVRGILLIDEIEQHLHPSLQERLVPELSELFPEMQIIVATHSPVATLGVEPSEVIVLKREGAAVSRREEVPDYRGYSYEDVLTHEAIYDTPPHGTKDLLNLERWRVLNATPRKLLSAAELSELETIQLRFQMLFADSERSSSLEEDIQELRNLYGP